MANRTTKRKSHSRRVHPLQIRRFIKAKELRHGHIDCLPESNPPTTPPPPVTSPTSPPPLVTSPSTPSTPVTSPKPQEQPVYTLDPRLAAALREHFIQQSESAERTWKVIHLMQEAANTIRDNLAKATEIVKELETSDYFSQLNSIGSLDWDSDWDSNSDSEE